MKISKKELTRMEMRLEGLNRFKKQTGATTEAVDILSSIGGEKAKDLLQIAGKIIIKENLVELACDVALRDIDSIRRYTNHFELIKESLKSRAFTNDALDAVYAVYDAIMSNLDMFFLVDAIYVVEAINAVVDAAYVVGAAYVAEAVNAQVGRLPTNKFNEV